MRIRHQLLLLVVIGAIAAGAVSLRREPRASGGRTPDGPPRILVEPGAWNTPPVAAGGSVRGRVMLRNGGGGELAIHRVVSSCGCSKVRLGRDRLSPGEEAELSITFRARPGAGSVATSAITVLSNDPVSPAVHIPVVARVIPRRGGPQLVVDPATVRVAAWERDGTVRLRIKNLGPEQQRVHVRAGAGKPVRSVAVAPFGLAVVPIELADLLRDSDDVTVLLEAPGWTRRVPVVVGSSADAKERPCCAYSTEEGATFVLNTTPHAIRRAEWLDERGRRRQLALEVAPSAATRLTDGRARELRLESGRGSGRVWTNAIDLPDTRRDVVLVGAAVGDNRTVVDVGTVGGRHVGRLLAFNVGRDPIVLDPERAYGVAALRFRSLEPTLLPGRGIPFEATFAGSAALGGDIVGMLSIPQPDRLPLTQLVRAYLPWGSEDGLARVDLAVAGGQRGRLFPRLCTGRAVGGLARLKRAVGQSPSGAVFLHTGDLVGGPSPGRELRCSALAAGLRQCGCAALVPGASELSLPPEDLKALGREVPVTACNVVHGGARVAEPWVRVSAGQLSIAVIGVVGSEVLSEPSVLQQGYTILHAPQAIRAALGQVAAAEGIDLRVGLVHAGRGTLQELRSLFPEVNIWLVSEEQPSAEIPDCVYSPLFGDMLVRAQAVRRHGIWEVESSASVLLEGEFEVESLPVDVELERLRTHWERAGTGASPVMRVRASECAGCHPLACRTWESNRHSMSLDSLAETGDAGNPECLTCHGSDGDAGANGVRGRGPIWCGTCHEGSEVHAASRAARTRLKPCAVCHTGETDREFEREKAWARIKHR